MTTMEQYQDIVVAEGSWMYADGVPVEIKIFKGHISRWMDDPDAPECDRDGYYFYATHWYTGEGSPSSIAEPRESLDAAIRHVERVVARPIQWRSGPPDGI